MVNGFLCAVTGHAPAFIFDLKDTNIAELARPQIQDVLEHVAEHHHLRCGCDLRVGYRAWLTSIPLSNAADCEWRVLSGECLAVDANIEGPARPTEPASIRLVIAGEQAPATDYLRLYREKHFIPVCVGDARVFTRSGATPWVPLLQCSKFDECSRFDELCSIPGFTFVDKSEPLRGLLHHCWSSRINLIRRPKGFGKTALLSLFDAYFDPYSSHAYFPFTFTHASMPIVRHAGQLLVFALDLADLSFGPTMLHDELVAECDRLMNAGARQFYGRYQKLLCAPEEETARPDFTPTFLDIIRWTVRQKLNLCFTIDNYTTPVLDGPNVAYEWSISQHIFDIFRALRQAGTVFYGVIVGDDVPHAANWHGLPPTFNDLTGEPSFAETIGFTLDEVAALDQVFPGDLMGALQSRAPTGVTPNAKRIYAASDVLSLVRSSSSSNDVLPVQVRTVDLELLPAVVLPAPFDPHTEGDDDEMDWEGYTDSRFGCWSDDEEGDSDQPPLTTDSSSDGSASSVPSPEAKDRIPQPPMAAPSSPTERYDKNLWSLDDL